MSSTDTPQPVHVLENSRCLDCWYSLQGLPEARCPECGRDFDPEDRRTYWCGEDLPWWHQWSKPPGRWHITLVIAVTLWAILDASSPGQAFRVACLFQLLYILLLPVLLVDFALRGVAARLVHRFHGEAGTPPSYRAPRWLVTPICTILLASLLLYPWPVWLRFRASLGSFEATVRRLEQTGAPTGSIGRVGLFWVRRVDGFGGGYWFFETGSDGIWGSKGILFSSSPAGFVINSIDGPDAEQQLAPHWLVAREGL